MDFYALTAKLKENKYVSEFFNPTSFAQFRRYLITGFVSFGIEYTMFYILYKIVTLEYIAANVIVYIVIFWVNFSMNRIWSFKSRDNLLRQLKLYAILFVINLVVANIFLMYFLSDVMGISPLISKVLVMGAVVSWNFILYKKVIYK